MRIVVVLMLVGCSDAASSTGPAQSVYGVRIDRISAVHWTGESARLEEVSPELVTALRAVRPAELSFEARVVLQNDAWALGSRLERLPMSSAALDLLRAEAVALVRRLAVPRDRWPRGRWSAPSELGSGWREMNSELPVLSHERAFALRRLFHLYHRGDERAIVGRLVALDDQGRPGLTLMASEIEVIELGSDGAARAQLFELDRTSLGTPARSFLREEHLVTHVPGLSADSFFLELDPPEPIETLPCRRCHDDATENSLPIATGDPDERRTALLRQIRAPWSEAAR